MKPDEFRDSVLGRWSSHPDWVRWRGRWCARLAFAPFAVIVLAGLFEARNPANWLDLLHRAPTLLTVAGIALGGALGAVMTLALCSRIAEWTAGRELRHVFPVSAARIDPWILLLALLLGAIGPFLLARIAGLEPSIRSLFLCFAIFPPLGLLFSVSGVDRADSTGSIPGKSSATVPSRLVRRPVLLAALIPVLVPWVMTLLHDLASLVEREDLREKIGRWLPGYEALGMPFLGTAVLPPLAFALFAAWRTGATLVPIKSGLHPGGETGNTLMANVSLWRRLWNWLRSLFLGPLPPQCVVAEHPAWLSDILKTFDGKPYEVTRIQLSPREVSPNSARHELAPLFGVPVPSVDQVQILERFQELYRGMINRDEPNSLRHDENSADLLVFGSPGSGRTTSLLACAVYAAFVRGQRVLFFVPDSLRQSAFVERIERFLLKLRLNYYLKVGTLNDATVDGWLNGTSPLPQILVGTVGAVEQHLYGYHCSSSQFVKLRRVVLLPEVIIVDDFLDFDDAERTHLPFLIDKQRLLLASEHLPLQVLVSCRKLAPLGEEVLGKRLFTLKHFDRKANVLSIRPRQGGQAWKVEVQSDADPANIERLIKLCLDRGLDVVLYRSQIDEDERQAQESHLSSKGGPGSIAVISDLERPLSPLKSTDVDAIFYEEALCHEICLALRLHAGHDETVIFSISPTGMAQEANVGIVPVVADRTATPLMVAHLGSACRFLRPLIPVHVDLWHRFGVDYQSARALVGGLTLAEESFFVDIFNDADYRAELWPYLVVGKSGLTCAPVDIFGLPDLAWAVYRSAANDKLFIGRPTSALKRTHPARRAAWFDDGAEFGNAAYLDLAHAYRFRLFLGRRSIGLRTIIQQAADGSIRLLGDIWHGNGIDRHLPVFHLKWTLPANQMAGGFWGSVGDGLRWFNLSCEELGVQVDAQIIGHMSDSAETTDLNAISFKYHARVSGMLFRPIQADQDILAKTLGAGLAGEWSTGAERRFWPVLTGALNYAIRVRNPGMQYFARILAFQLTGEAEQEFGSAVAWLIEPTTGGSTASRVVGDLLRKPQERKGFFQSATWFLKRLAESRIAKDTFIRQMTHLGWKGDDRIQMIDEALKLVQVISGRDER